MEVVMNLKRMRRTIGLAIFSLTLLTVAPLLRADDDEADERGFLGVYPVNLDDQKREALDFEKGNGVLIEDVVAEGPADKAGLEAGDIITKLDGKPVAASDELIALLKNHKPGDEISVTVRRQKNDKTLTVRLGEAPDDDDMVYGGPRAFTHRIEIGKGGWLGVGLINLEEQLAEYFGVKSGALVESVGKDSPAEKAGIKAGDVIVRIDDEEVESDDDLREAVREHNPGDKVKIKLVRKGAEMEVSATLDEKQFHGSVGPGPWRWHSGQEWLGIDPDELESHIREALKDLDVEFNLKKGELREQLKELQSQIDQLKAEVKKLGEAKQ